MIALVLGSVGLLLVIAVVVGIEDAVHAPARRLLAAERRQRWEAGIGAGDGPSIALSEDRPPRFPGRMDEWTELALGIDVTAAGAAVQVAAVTEAGHQADALLGEPPIPGSVEWHAEDGTDTPTRRERAWQLLQLRIGLAAGLDPLPTLIGLHRHGASWVEIALAMEITSTAAREQWESKVAAVLNPS